MSNGNTAHYTAEGMDVVAAKMAAKRARFKMKLFVVTQFCVSLTGTTYFQMAYNDVKFIAAFSLKELTIITLMTLFVAFTAALVTFQAFMSDSSALKDPKSNGAYKRALPGEELPLPEAPKFPHSLNDPQTAPPVKPTPTVPKTP